MEMSERWDGPMSVSLFAPGLDASFADDAIDGLRLCWPVLREFMTFHLGNHHFSITYLQCSSVSDRNACQYDKYRHFRVPFMQGHYEEINDAEVSHANG